MRAVSKITTRAIFSFLLFILHLTSVSAEKWWDDDSSLAPIRSKERAVAERAYKAFADERYSQALRYLNQLTVSPDERTSLETMKKIWQKRSDLGEISPSFVYRALIINMTLLDADTADGKHVRSRMTEKEALWAELYMNMTARTYEAFSNGQMTIDFDFITVDEAITSLTFPDEPGMEFPRIDSVEGLPELLRKRMNDYDILILHSPGDVTGTALGGEWAIPYVEYALYGPRRGRLILNTLHNYGIWVHELFHSLENHAKISVIHGYYSEPRVNFPNWQGISGDQFDFFNWQFETSIGELGIKNLNYRFRYKDPTTEEQLQNVMKIYRNISLEDRYEADRFYTLGRSGRDPFEKEENFRKAIELSPLHSSALYYYGQLLQKQSRFEEAAELYELTGRYFPRPSVWLGAGQSWSRAGEIDAAIKAYQAGAASEARDSIEQYRKAECLYELATLTDQFLGDKEAAYEQVFEAIRLGYDYYRSRELLVNLQPGDLSYNEISERYSEVFSESYGYAHILSATAGRKKDPDLRLRLLETSLPLWQQAHEENPDDGNIRYSYGGSFYEAGLIYYQKQDDLEKAYRYATSSLENGYIWNRSVDLFVLTMPDNLTMDNARRLLYSKIAGSDKVEYGFSKLRERFEN